MPGPQVDEAAPDFTLPRAPSKEYTLGDFRGKMNVVVSFVALSFTGGGDWGVEGTLRRFQRYYEEFEKRDTVVIVISADSMYCNEALSRSLGGLPFPILADFLPRGVVSREWDCWSPDREHPRNVTSLIDKQGIVRNVEYHEKGGIPNVRALLGVIDGLG